MYRIIAKLPERVAVITIQKAMEDYVSNIIIAYLIRNGTGLAVLQLGTEGWGFVYHVDLVLGQPRKPKFIAETKKEAIEKALEQREVYSFESFSEFLAFAAKHYEI
jgi:hypothetical protein